MERGTIQGTMVCRETWPGEQRTRRDLQRPRAELAVDVFVGDDADAAPAAHRHLCLAPHQVLVPARSDRGVLQRSDIEVVQQTAVRWWQQHADKPLNRSPPQPCSPRVLGVHRHRGVAQNGLGAGGGHRQELFGTPTVARRRHHRVFEVVEGARLLAVLYL